MSTLNVPLFKSHSRSLALLTLLNAIPLFSFAQTVANKENISAVAPVEHGYAPINGLQLYYEIHGTGEPLILLHGGLGSLKCLAKTFLNWRTKEK